MFPLRVRCGRPADDLRQSPPCPLPSSGGDSTAPYVRHSGRRHPAGSDRTVAKATTDPTTSTPAHTVIARPNALSNAVGDRYASSPSP